MLWPEFLQEGGELLHKLPSKYEEGMKFDYVNVSIQYYVSIDEENYTLLKGQKIVNDESVYTFTFPDKWNIQGTIRYRLQQLKSSLPRREIRKLL